MVFVFFLMEVENIIIVFNWEYVFIKRWTQTQTRTRFKFENVMQMLAGKLCYGIGSNPPFLHPKLKCNLNHQKK
jgi:hypothetical protein